MAIVFTPLMGPGLSCFSLELSTSIIWKIEVWKALKPAKPRA